MGNDLNNFPINQANPPVNQAPVPQATVLEDRSSGGKGMIWFLAIGLIVIVALIGGVAYWYMQKQKAENEAASIVTSDVTAPAPLLEDELAGELNSLNLGTIEDGFSEVDQDLQNL